MTSQICGRVQADSAACSKSSRAKRTGQMIVRIVEDDLHPDESAAK
jgi:hypothetical protein